MSETRLSRLRARVRKGVASVGALVAASVMCGSLLSSTAYAAGSEDANPANYFYGSGIEMTGLDASNSGFTGMRLYALSAPAGYDIGAPSFCIDADSPAPNSADGGAPNVQGVQSYTEGNRQGTNTPGDLYLTVQQINYALMNYGSSRDATTLAALSLLVHANLENSTQDSSNYNIGWLTNNVRSHYPSIYSTATEIARASKTNTIASTDPGKKTGNLKSGEITNIGVKNASGSYVGGANVTVTLSGPAAFNGTNSQSWSGVTGTNPMTLGWHATGNGTVKVNITYSNIPLPSVRRVVIAGKQDIVTRPESPTTSASASLSFEARLYGWVKAQKVSEKPEYTTENKGYDMTGATFGVYSDAAATKKVGELVVSDNKGVTNELRVEGDLPYYIKELKAAKGYIVNPRVYKINVPLDQHVTARLDGDYIEPIVDDPISLVVQKSFSEWDQGGKLQGDITSLAGVKFRLDYYKNIYRSKEEAQASGKPTMSAVWQTDAKGYLHFDINDPVEGTWSYKKAGYNTIPLGTVIITEVSAIEGMSVNATGKAFTITDAGLSANPRPKITQIGDNWPKQDAHGAQAGTYENHIWRGGVTVVKADADWHTSEAQGDATLNQVEYQIINKSANSVSVDGHEYQVGDVVMTIATHWDEATKRYVATTGNKVLPYGTYHIQEVTPSEGYLNANWQADFTIRKDGQMHMWDVPASRVDTTHKLWNENAVQRGGVIIGKVDRETGQYTPLGEATLDGAVFEIINRSKAAVFVDGKTFKPGEVVKTISSETMEWNGKQIIAAYTGDHSLPYGTYDIREVSSPTGYLFDSASKKQQHTFQVRADGQVIDYTSNRADGQTFDAIHNQVIREDFHFQKKSNDGSSKPLAHVPFLVESVTTGEKHVIVTDENGTFYSSAREDSPGYLHSEKTNANDPTSPITNGAMGVDEQGNWYVKDSSKLDPTTGVWFTGLSPDAMTWNADAKSYVVDGVTVMVNDELRAMPYDTYKISELRADGNTGYNLVDFTVTLHKYTRDHDGIGLDIDYGTVDDKPAWIGTQLTFEGEKLAPSTGEITLTDRVDYDLDPGREYTLSGELHQYDADGKDLGVVATGSTTFTPDKPTGHVDVTFTFDASTLSGSKLVAFEKALDTKSGIVVTTHEDPDDEGQTVHTPKIGTTAHGDIDHEKNGAVAEIELVDTVAYHNLIPGKTYTMSGTLMDKATGKPVVDKDGKEVTASQEFTASQSDGTVDVTFRFAPGDITGTTVVAFESLSKDGREFAVHTDIEDEDQTVTIPGVKTKASDKADGDSEIAAAQEQVIVDTVSATNLIVGKTYTVSGTLHKKVVGEDGTITDGGQVTDADGKPIVATKEFTADKPDMTVELEFTVDARALAGQTVVVFEDLHRDKVLVGAHANIEDADQSVTIPKIGTTLTTDTGDKDIAGGQETITLVDTVAYTNLVPGSEYTLHGTLHIRATEDGKIVDKGELTVDGKPVTASATFTPTEANGTVDMTFTFPSTALEDGTTITAFEQLNKGKIEVAAHADITDDGQSVTKPKIGTKAHDTVTGEQIAVADEHQSITDVISYQGLTPGKEYTMSGTLHMKHVDEDGKVSDGGIVKDKDGKDVTSSVTFTPTEANGSVEVVFEFDAPEQGYRGNTVVAFEELSRDKVIYATHADIEDEDQSVDVPGVHTTATDAQSNAHEGKVRSEITINDVVSYTNLIPGKEYTVSGTLHSQVKDGETIIDGGIVKDKDGKDVTASVTFTPETPSGEVTVPFTFTPADTFDKVTVVVFEDVMSGEHIVATHSDITDEAQSVRYERPIPPPDTPRTPITLKTGIMGGSLALLLLGASAAGLYFARRRKTIS